MDNNDWQKHLDGLDEHYAPENFFIDKFAKPNRMIKDADDYYAPLTFPEATNHAPEGQLAIDLLEDAENLYVIAPITGSRPEDIEIKIDRDILTVSGTREQVAAAANKNWLYRECFWGNFSRSIVLPAAVNNEGIKAICEKGVLTIILPKIAEIKRIIIGTENNL